MKIVWLSGASKGALKGLEAISGGRQALDKSTKDLGQVA